MNRFAALLDRLIYEPRRNAKLRLMEDYFRTTSDPERGLALAAIAETLDFPHAKPAMIRALAAERTDPYLFDLSYDYVGDLSETVALIWPTRVHDRAPPSLSEVVSGLRATPKPEVPALLAGWLDALDETGRWALLKLLTGGLRVGVSARLVKTAVAVLGERDVAEIEEVWHGLEPPYVELFAWLEGRSGPPDARDPAPFRAPMLSHPIDESGFAKLDPAEFVGEWKWDGIRVQAVAGRRADGRWVRRLYSRTGDDISGAFPDLLEALDFEGALDGELLVRRDGRVQPFSELQKRLNRKTVSARMMAAYPAHIRAYDLLALDGEDLRSLPFEARRRRLEALVAAKAHPRLDLSPLLPFASWEELAGARAEPALAGRPEDAEAVEGCMIKRRDSPYVAGRPKGLWYKWKRAPHTVDAVVMYAQRGHGKRSSFYSDYTFGVWRDAAHGPELVPVGKAYSGYTDEELIDIDRFIRRNTVNRYGPVREVVHEPHRGLVIEVAFEGLNRSTRHKSGVAMRFPRILRLRWDKPPIDADRIQTLEALLPEESG